MRVFKTACTTGLAMLCLSFSLKAQNQNDTVRVEVSNNTSLEYIFKRPKDFSSFQKVNIDSLTDVLATTISTLPNNVDTTIDLNAANNTSGEITREKSQTIELSGKLGVSLVRHTLAPDYGGRISINFFSETRHGLSDPIKKRTSIFAEYQHMVFFERDPDLSYQSFGNGFVNLGFGFQAMNSGMVLNLGYLARPSGNYFGSNTFKAEFQYQILDKLSISPFIIATDNFNSFIPGFRIALLN